MQTVACGMCRSPSTRSNHLRRYFKDVPVEDITEHRIRQYKAHRRKLGRSGSTVNREVQLLGQAMRLAHHQGLLKGGPSHKKIL